MLVMHHEVNKKTKEVRSMKKVLMIVMALIISIAFVTTVMAQDKPAKKTKQESTGEYVDDSYITTKVKSLLAADDFLKSFEISVKTFKGDVQLSGSVDSKKAVDKAGEITRSVKGVKSVKNNLIVK
jgi:hyperosmotically inducible protein